MKSNAHQTVFCFEPSRLLFPSSLLYDRCRVYSALQTLQPDALYKKAPPPPFPFSFHNVSGTPFFPFPRANEKFAKPVSLFRLLLCFSFFFARSFRCNVCKRKKEWARLRTKMGFCQTYTPKWYHFGCTGMGIGGVCYCAVGRKWYFLEQQGTSFLASVFPAFPCLKLPIHRFLSGEKRRISIYLNILILKNDLCTSWYNKKVHSTFWKGSVSIYLCRANVP